MGYNTYRPTYFVFDGQPLLALCRSNELTLTHIGLSDKDLIEGCFIYRGLAHKHSSSPVDQADDLLRWFWIPERLCDEQSEQRLQILEFNIQTLTDGLYAMVMEMIDPIAIRYLGRIYFDRWLKDDIVITVDT